MKTLSIIHLTIAFILLTGTVLAQEGVGINKTGNNPDPSAMLDINANDRGLLIPRMSSAERLAISNPANALMVYDSDLVAFYYYDAASTSWKEVLDFKTGWTTSGNTGTNPSLQYLGSADNVGVSIRTNAMERMHVTAAGYVGIGTNTPDEQLHVVGNVKANGFIGDGSTLTNVGSSALQDAGVHKIDMAQDGADSGDAIMWDGSQWVNQPNDDGDWMQSGGFVYKESGKVGVGTSMPNAAIHVKANVPGGSDLANPEPGDHVMIIENTNTDFNSVPIPNLNNLTISNATTLNTNSNNGLAINLNVPYGHLDTRNHFVTFYRNDDNIAGRIEGEHIVDFLQFRGLVENTINGVPELLAGVGNIFGLMELNVTYNPDFATLSGGHVGTYGVWLSGGRSPSIDVDLDIDPSIDFDAGSFPHINNNFSPPVFPTIGVSSPFTFGDPILGFGGGIESTLSNTFLTLNDVVAEFGGTGLLAYECYKDQIACGIRQGLILSNSLSTGGVTYQSASGDYAEWLIRENPDEVLMPGDVIGVYAGKITHKTEGADHVMVVSVDPIVLGNTPPEGYKEYYTKVAFMGQVPVKVNGEVRKGDILLASGDNNGSAIGLSVSEVMPEHLGQILGVAWSDSYNDKGTSYVKTSVGLRSAELGQILSRFQTDLQSLASYKAKTDELTAEVEESKDLLNDIAKRMDAVEQRQNTPWRFSSQK